MSISAPKSQQGLALITVLLVFALVAVISGDVALRNFRDIRKTSNLINSKQAYYYALAGEEYARQLLYRDFSDKADASDSLSDNWANIDDLFDVENGAMSIKIIDLHNRFNLNNLLDGKGRINSAVLKQFQDLLLNLGIDENIAFSALDWIDGNKQALAGGAEDEIYAQRDYLAANSPFVDRSELRLIEHVSVSDYHTLKDYVVALPLFVNNQKIGLTKYNINTLDAKLVEAFSSNSNTQLDAISKRQQRGGYNTLTEWTGSGLLDSLSAVNAQLDVKSDFFEIIVRAEFDQRMSVVRTHLHRNANNGEITVIKRQQGFE